MDFRRQSQLDLAAKLRANVSVLMGDRNAAPEIIPLDHVRRPKLQASQRVYVQVLSWTDPNRIVEVYVHDDGTSGVNEERLAAVVDKALERFAATV